MKIKKNDTVLVISGKDRGRKGKVIKVLRRENKIVIEGLNLIKKHLRPKRQGEKGQRIELPAPLDSSNVKIICPKCKKATRVSKKRICKKCQSQI